MTDADGGHLQDSVIDFCRLLRKAGMSIGPAQTVEAVRAVSLVGVGRRDDVRAALEAVLVTRADQRALFAEAFNLYWRAANQSLSLDDLMAEMVAPPPRAPAASRRLADAMAPSRRREERPAGSVELDARLAYSADETLRRKDFAQMSLAELADARAALQRLTLLRPVIRTRRLKPSAHGHRIDARATMRQSLATGGLALTLARRAPGRRPPALVALCDISGSMATYSRILLQFLHALGRDHDRVSSFVFGTRLTNITRALARRDVDEALARVSASVGDWGGGTRIGEALHVFNRDWSRRVLAQGAIVLLITDGLDRDAGAGLAEEAQRLRRSCRRLIWLNPLLRYAGFEPKSLGIRALLPHVDEMRPVHNLESLASLVEALSTGAEARRLAA